MYVVSGGWGHMYEVSGGWGHMYVVSGGWGHMCDLTFVICHIYDLLPYTVVRLVGVRPAVRGYTVRGQIGLDPLNQRQIAVAAHCGKADKLLHQFKRG